MTRPEMARGRLRVALVGAGYFSAFHFDGWMRNPDADLVAVADTDGEKAARLAATQGADGSVAIHEDAGRMLGEAHADIVDIAAPPSAHLGLIELALAAKPRAIICQKPFCGGLDGARRAVAMAREHGCLLVVHENFRFQPWYRLIRREIDGGRIGAVYQTTFRLRPGDGQGNDAYLSRQPYFQTMPRFLVHETGVHWIDTFRYLMGEPDAVYAELRRLNPVITGEDSGYMIYRFRDGRRALFDGNRLIDHPADNTRLTMGEMLVEGEKGVLSLDGYGVVSFRPIGSRDWQRIGGDHPQDRFGGDCVFALQKHVTDHLLHGQPIENEAAAYMRNMEIEEAVYRSAAENRVIELTGE